MEFLLKTPNSVRQNAIQDLVAARKASLSNLRAGNIKRFELHPRTRKDRTETIRFDVRTCMRVGVNRRSVTLFPQLCPELGEVQCVEWIPPSTAEHRLHRDRCGSIYLIVPFELPAVVRGDTQTPRLAALDPGVRTFQTYYSVDGEAGEIGAGASERVHGLHNTARRLLTRVKNAPRRLGHQTCRNMRRASARYFKRADSLLGDLHYKAAKFLCERFDILYVPSFRVSQMVVKELRTINSLTTERMLALCHYKFGQRLRYVAERYGCRLRETSEWYTSKTCGACGHCNRNLGGNKVFSCPSCDIRMDRDLNGARNNLLRGLLYH